jgi:hypothetical protein
LPERALRAYGVIPKLASVLSKIGAAGVAEAGSAGGVLARVIAEQRVRVGWHTAAQGVELDVALEPDVAAFVGDRPLAVRP